MFSELDLNYAHASSEAYFWGLSPFEEKEGKGCISFDLTPEQFLAVQATCSGAGLGTSIEECLSFMESRQELLLYCEDEDGYLGEYCPYGAFVGDGVDDQKLLVFWYETTSGTILAASFNEKGDSAFSVSLPVSREGGFHHQHIRYALAGRTLEMYHRWHNSYLRLHTEEGRIHHQEEVDFHNLHMVDLGYEPMPNVLLLLQKMSMKRKTI